MVSNASEVALDWEFSPIALAASPQRAGAGSASSATQMIEMMPRHIAAPRASVDESSNQLRNPAAIIARIHRAGSDDGRTGLVFVKTIRAR